MTVHRSGALIGVLALASAFGLAGRAVTGPSSSDRTISFYHIHTQERLTVTYKKAGHYVPAAMKQIDWIMRDWRKNEAIRMDPATIDLAWEMYSELGAVEPISIICGYRSEGTNAMLRKTRGGQASQSQHMTGKAIDITFPDVSLKRIRYSALIRERGGVGYYPTSGIPFVHVDTARVRAWPRLPRQELALLFPDGHTRHQPADGGAITTADVGAAQTKHRELAMQIAAFHADRRSPRRALVASVGPASGGEPKERKAYTVAALGSSATVTSQTPKPAPPAERRPFAVASLGPAPAPSDDDIALALGWDVSKKPEAQKQVASLSPDAAKPRLVATPKLIDRSSRFTANPSDTDRSGLASLVQKANIGLPAPALVQPPEPAVRPQKALAAAAATAPGTAAPKTIVEGPKLAALAPGKASASITDMSPDSLGSGWVQAPEFDEDHPEELAYRPFPLAPLLTDTPSAHDPQLAMMQHPDVAATLEMIDDIGEAAPMRFRPGAQVAQVLWAQQFQGKAVHLDALQEIDQSRLIASGIESRTVQTSSR